MPAYSNHLYPAGQPRVRRIVGGELPRATAADAARTMVDQHRRDAVDARRRPRRLPVRLGRVVHARRRRRSAVRDLPVSPSTPRNLAADQRASLLVAEPRVDAGTDPLARSRVTLLGDARIGSRRRAGGRRRHRRGQHARRCRLRRRTATSPATAWTSGPFAGSAASARWTGSPRRLSPATVDPVLPAATGSSPT